MLHIVIPVYNEGDNIAKTLRAVRTHVKTPHVVDIIYDFDQDNTLAVVQREKQENIRLIKNKFGQGALNAIKTGFDSANGDAIVVVMADLSDRMELIDKMYEKVCQGYHLVCGSRYMRGGKQTGGPLLKRWLSRIAGVSLYYLTGIPTKDVTNSFKMYTKELLNHIEIESRGGFEVGMEITVKAFKNGFKITELPSVWRGRKYGESRFRLTAWLPRYLHWYLYALIRKPRRHSA